MEGIIISLVVGTSWDVAVWVRMTIRIRIIVEVAQVDGIVDISIFPAA